MSHYLIWLWLRRIKIFFYCILSFFLFCLYNNVYTHDVKPVWLLCTIPVLLIFVCDFYNNMPKPPNEVEFYTWMKKFYGVAGIGVIFIPFLLIFYISLIFPSLIKSTLMYIIMSIYAMSSCWIGGSVNESFSIYIDEKLEQLNRNNESRGN